MIPMGIINNVTNDPSTRLVASSKTWIESQSLEQLKKARQLPHMQEVVGLPDIHPGNVHPVGASFLSKHCIYPHLVGGDIGCGMGLWKTHIPITKWRLERIIKQLKSMEEPWSEDSGAWLEAHNVNQQCFLHALGTIGGGNHFSEFQTVDTIFNSQAFEALGLSSKNVYLLVHSGSRGYGQKILDHHIDHYGHNGFDANTDAGKDYLESHNDAIKWAKANRFLIAHRFMNASRTQGENLFDVCHNMVEPFSHKDDAPHLWFHRKGTTPSSVGPVMIPGSRGALSYLVVPTTNASIHRQALYSLAHGAGRKWKRTDARGKLKKYRLEDFEKTPLGSHVICEDKALMFEEAPQAYKNISHIIADLVECGLITIVATFRPLLTYKVRKSL
jgi:release factor H-coupled RctB family protein